MSQKLIFAGFTGGKYPATWQPNNCEPSRLRSGSGFNMAMSADHPVAEVYEIKNIGNTPPHWIANVYFANCRWNCIGEIGRRFTHAGDAMGAAEFMLRRLGIIKLVD